MADEDILQKLASLTGRQREILKKVCAGNDYQTIAKELVISEETVKSHVGNIYVKLGLDQMPVSLRRKAIYETYCPALHEAEFATVPTEPTEPTEPEPVPQAIQKMVDQDDLLLLQPESKRVIQVLPPSKLPHPKPKWGFIIILLAVIILAIFGGFKIYEWANGLIHPAVPLPAVTPVEVYTVVTATPLPATNTPVPSVTSTALPTATATLLPPTAAATAGPVIALPFKDNFDQGLNPAWKTLNGQWLTVNGKLTITQNDGTFQMIMLDDPSWKNYRVSADFTISHPYSADAGSFAIGVRCLSSDEKYIGFLINTFTPSGWAFLGSSVNDSPMVSGNIDYDSIKISGKYEMEVNGNDFTARINGKVVQEINLTGYDNGGVILALQGWGDGPSVDNFEVDPLP